MKGVAPFNILLLADTLYLQLQETSGVLYSQRDILYRQFFFNLNFFLPPVIRLDKLWIFRISACLEFVLIAAGDNYLVDLFKGGGGKYG